MVLEHSIPQLCITLSDKVITEYKEKQITIGEVYRQMGISYDTDEAMEVLKKDTPDTQFIGRESRHCGLSGSKTGKLQL